MRATKVESKVGRIAIRIDPANDQYARISGLFSGGTGFGDGFVVVYAYQIIVSKTQVYFQIYRCIRNVRLLEFGTRTNR